jgi:MFS transporter, DHA3 family, macrolide efflux protein
VPALGVFLGLLLGLIAGGHLDGLTNVRLRWLPLLLWALVARFGLDALLSAGAVPDALRLWLVLLAYIGLTVVLVANSSLPGIAAAALGTAANGIAIVANGGWMPVWQPSLAAAGLDSTAVHSNFHRMLDGPVDGSFFAHGGPLVDLIPIPFPMIQSVSSIGDVLLAVGLAFFVFAAVVRAPVLVSIPIPQAQDRGVTARLTGPFSHPYVRLATNGPFSAMWLAQVVSSLGDRVHQVALVYLVARATNSSPLALGLVFAAMTLPTVAVGPLAGTLVDRWDRKRVMVASDLIRAGIVCLIPVASGLNVGFVVGLVFVLAAVSSFFRPARSAALPQVVPDEDLLTANSSMWIADTVSDLAGYSLGGLFVAFLGSSLALAFWIDGASYLISGALVAAVVIPPIAGLAAGADRLESEGADAASPPASIKTSIREEMAEGWRCMRAEAVLFATTVQATIAEYGLGALTVLSPLLIAELPLGDLEAPAAYGFFEMAMGAGLVGGGIVLGSLATRLHKGPAIIAAFSGLGVALIALSATGSLALALALAAAVGIANAAFVVPSQTLFQQHTPSMMLGRVVAIRLAMVSAALAVAMVTSGGLAQAFGLRPILFGCGLLTAVVGLAGLAVRSIREA